MLLIMWFGMVFSDVLLHVGQHLYSREFVRLADICRRLSDDGKTYQLQVKRLSLSA